MSSLKQAVLDFLTQQQGDVSADELINFIYIHKKLDIAEQAIKAGKTYSIDEARELLSERRG